MITNSNKRIAINTIVIYIRLFIVSCISIIMTRYVLQALGVSDYGLYNVVSSILVMLNCVSTGMHTTTRRFINVEMGNINGNMNKIFNICMIVHFGFALLIFILGEVVGIWYINNYLNIPTNKIEDAHFVFQIAIIVSCMGILNVPYQSLIEAYEKFWQSAVVDIINAVTKLVAVFILVKCEGNALRIYSLIIGGITISSFIMYRLLCYHQWHGIVKFHYYNDNSLYKRIIIFNNYVSLGAFGFLIKTQGINIIINYFFGTLLNAAYAVATQIDHFVNMLVSNLATSSGPQITQNISAGNYQRSFDICARINRYVILLMSLIFFPMVIGINYILVIWLGTPPNSSALFSKWILICGFIGCFSSSLSNYVMAYGKIKTFTIASTVIDIIFLLVSFFFFIIWMSCNSNFEVTSY